MACCRKISVHPEDIENSSDNKTQQDCHFSAKQDSPSIERKQDSPSIERKQANSSNAMEQDETEQDIPSNETEQDNPSNETEQDSPSNETEQDSPSNETEQESPSNETEQDSPSKETEQDSPSNETEQDSPSNETEQDSPSNETEQDSPSNEKEQDSPSNETEQDSPSNETEQDSPSNETEQDRPSNETEQDSPSNETEQDSPSNEHTEQDSPFNETEQDSPSYEDYVNISTDMTCNDQDRAQARTPEIKRNSPNVNPLHCEILELKTLEGLNIDQKASAKALETIFGAANISQESKEDDKYDSSSQETDPIKILLVGETGSGKTSFIELFMNYAYMKNQKFKIEDIKCYVSSEMREKKESSMKIVSDTRTTTPYTAEIGSKKIVIIDTPGLADTRDNKQNINNIITTVKKGLYINCICLIINGTQCRLTTLLKEIFENISAILSPEVFENIVVVFTNTNDDWSLNFDPNQIYAEFGFEPKHIFTLQNPYARWERAIQKGRKPNTLDVQTEFQNAFEMLDEMCISLHSFKPVISKRFGDLFNLIEILQDKAAILDAKLVQKSQLQGKNTEMFEHRNTQLKLNAIRKELVFTPNKNLVCSICEKTCHLSCKCKKIFSMIHAELYLCKEFDRTHTCKQCGHHSNDHIKAMYCYKTADEDSFSQKFANTVASMDEMHISITFAIQNIFMHLEMLHEIMKDFPSIIFVKNFIENMKRYINKLPEFETKIKLINKLSDMQKLLIQLELNQ